MRVIGGTLRGRKLSAPRGYGTRPTADRVRESLFNVLAPTVADAAVLDLFAGSGALGIEALSRGARFAVFVESDAGACAVLRQNVERLGLQQQAHVRQARVEAAIGRLAASGQQFDLILMDPPYGSRLTRPVLAQLADEQLAAPDAVVAVEHDRRDDVPESAGSGAQALVRFRVLQYGDTAVSLYRLQEPPVRRRTEEVDG